MTALELGIGATYVVQIVGIAVGVGAVVAWLGGRFAR